MKQIGIVNEYQGHFERLLSCVGRLSPSQQVCCFISGLKGHLRVDVQALKPISVSVVVGLAHLYEAKCHSQQRLLPSGENEESLPLSLSTGKTIKKLNPIELNERWNLASTLKEMRNLRQDIDARSFFLLKWVGLINMKKIPLRKRDNFKRIEMLRSCMWY